MEYTASRLMAGTCECVETLHGRYAFKGLKASQHPKYVQAYMDRFDTLDTEAKRAVSHGMYV